MSKKIPFRISARTARLIGRQNFSNAEGALIELVKNSYDADASQCIVFFDNQYAILPEILTPEEFKKFANENHLILKHYVHDERKRSYILTDIRNTEVNLDSERQELTSFFQSKCKIHIIDNGEGMTDRIIENFWMTIGTNNKEEEIFTKDGRIKTGAKGIGRFALDRLGDVAEMLTKPDSGKHEINLSDGVFLWHVDWKVFDDSSRKLDEITADLIEDILPNFPSQISSLLPKYTYEKVDEFDDQNKVNLESFVTGTHIEISMLRDVWDDRSVRKMFTNLEVLIPPREQQSFEIYVFSTLNSHDYGLVSPSICDDYDYKIEACVRSNGKVRIVLYRNELDLIKVPDSLFTHDAMQGDNYSREAFETGKIFIDRDISQIVPGLAEVDTTNILENIGEFDGVFYFMKRTVATKDRDRFKYKNFGSSARVSWLNSFGGIKLFRDNFRVRPYGEVNKPTFDWLELANRVERSPAGLAHPSGRWRVRPNQISGIINISRLTNINFEDQSNRQGIQENRHFYYFIQIIGGILNEFERDRQHIAKALDDLYKESRKDAERKRKATEVKKRLKERKDQDNTTDSSKDDTTNSSEDDAKILLDYTEDLESQIEVLNNELKLLRILASSGLVVASFTHELKGIKNKLVSRVNTLEEIIRLLVADKQYDLPDFLDPWLMLDDIKRQDVKLKQWLHYSLETLRRDKRRRRDLNLLLYFEKYRDSWQLACQERDVDFVLHLPQTEKLIMRVFEADLDSIFNNLLINSFEAFLRKDAPADRVITIKAGVHGDDLHIHYIDSGPGLSKGIMDPKIIFEPHFTTRKDIHTGEDVGTGLGMWLVKTFIEENNGSIEYVQSDIGFNLHILFPDKVKK